MCIKCDKLKELLDNNNEQLSAFKLLSQRVSTPETVFAMPIDSKTGKHLVLMTPKKEGIAVVGILPSTEVMATLGIDSTDLIHDFDPEALMIALSASGDVINQPSHEFMKSMATMGVLADMMDMVSSAQEESMAEEEEQEKAEDAPKPESPIKAVDGTDISYIHAAPETKQ
ncbi:hypothetical protein VH22019_00071 [Vibrio phage VH2_2019]|nr:hypothetical protein VH22019_00071 [Vibrio phage VH2_2019]